MLHTLNYVVINRINNMNDDELHRFSRINEGFKVERSATGNITMAPTFLIQDFLIATYISNWAFGIVPRN